MSGSAKSWIIMARKSVLVALVTFAGLLNAISINAREKSPSASTPPTLLPSIAQVAARVNHYFQGLPGHSPNRLIVASEVTPILEQLEKQGWKDLSQADIFTRLVSDTELLARELRSPEGQAFMQRTANYKLIYDRLDRVSRSPGGARLLHDLIRLPDGYRYAQVSPPPSVPTLTDLLPKGASGKTAHVADMNKPTGRIYTVADLLHQLDAVHRQTQER
jgi:hypothetical protein